jgi:hypothetical protein
MKSVKEKLIDELTELRNRLNFKISLIEFKAKEREETTYKIDDLLKVYKNMLNYVDDLINKYEWED